MSVNSGHLRTSLVATRRWKAHDEAKEAKIKGDLYLYREKVLEWRVLNDLLSLVGKGRKDPFENDTVGGVGE